MYLMLFGAIFFIKFLIIFQLFYLLDCLKFFFPNLSAFSFDIQNIYFYFNFIQVFSVSLAFYLIFYHLLLTSFIFF